MWFRQGATRLASDLSLNLIVDHRREVRLPSVAEPFEPSCHVDPVAVNIVSIRDRNVLIFRCGRAIVSHQHEKTRRIRFVTPTKLPYPWNLMS